ncbi:Tau-tubulin kinase 1 [Aphelenchoides fujianensis]|nr:Tau-tubulin kinase 1 [Aphelenchoides fujianensis]
MTSSSEGEILQNSQVIRDRWKIKSKLGGGGFGEIYEAIDLQSHNERVAVKVESAKATKQVLKMEVAVLRRLQGKKHACKFYGCGRNDKYNYLVMSLQGKNLADLRRESPKQCFSVSTALRLASQILVAIREIHSIGFLHRDVKPSNFAMGRTASTMRIVFMLDFGLARLYLNARGEIRSPRLAAGFRGTVRYAAVSAHKNKEMGRQDDLWSLFYMLVEFLQGSLPWRRIKDKDEVGRMKDEANHEQLLEGCPYELLEIPKHLKTLSYPDEPNYDLLERCLWSCMARLGINMDDPFDWELGYENISGRSKTTSNTTTNGNVSTRMRSHTTAVRDRGPDEKNRAMDTQAPITMGEDEDEQTGNYNYKIPPLGSSMKSSQHDENDKHDKPKYKRQEFMRPKYGALSFDVIHQVNARLAAADGVAGGGEQAPAANGQNNELFSKMRIETSVENDPRCIHYASTREVVEATIEQPPASRPQTAGSGSGASNGPSTNGEVQPKANGTTAKQPNRSITCSIGKRYQNGSRSKTPAPAAPLANGEDESASNGRERPAGNRWQDSFEQDGEEADQQAHFANGFQLGDYGGGRSPLLTRYARSKQLDAIANGFPQSPTMNGDLSGYLSPRSNRRLLPASKSSQPLLNTITPPSSTPSVAQSNGDTKEANGTAKNRPAAKSTQKSPSPSPKSPKTSAASASSSSANGGGGGLYSHLKTLVNTSLEHVRKRSLSRGISLDEARQRQQLAATASAKQRQNAAPSPSAPSPTQATTPSTTSGFGSLSTNESRPLTREDTEREIRRQRRLRRRSDCAAMIPGARKDGSLSPTRTAVHKTVIVNVPSAHDYSRLLGSNVVNDSSNQNYDKSGQSCRRKRYQFLNFGPRAMSRS